MEHTALTPLELELQAIWGPQAWVLGTNSRPSAKYSVFSALETPLQTLQTLR